MSSNGVAAQATPTPCDDSAEAGDSTSPMPHMARAVKRPKWPVSLSELSSRYEPDVAPALP